MGRPLNHAAAAATLAEPAPTARERHEPVVAAVRASEPGEAAAERATPEKTTELLFDEPGHALPVPEGGRLRQERLEVVAHHLMQYRLPGLPRLIRR